MRLWPTREFFSSAWEDYRHWWINQAHWLVYRVVSKGDEQTLQVSGFFTKLTKLTLREPCDVDEALHTRDKPGRRWREAARAARRLGFGLSLSFDGLDQNGRV